MSEFGGDKMLAGLSNCKITKATPASVSVFEIANQTGTMPKLVHISCSSDSHAIINNGYVVEAWYTQNFGTMATRNGSNGGNVLYWQYPENQIPTARDKYYLSENTIVLNQGNATSTGRWSTQTEYSVEIYT